MQVNTIKLKNGEEFIAEVVEQSDGVVTVKCPVVVLPDGSGGYNFSPWLISSIQKEYGIEIMDIRFSVPARSEFIEAYERNFGEKSEIITPQSEIILG